MGSQAANPPPPPPNKNSAILVSDSPPITQSPLIRIRSVSFLATAVKILVANQRACAEGRCLLTMSRSLVSPSSLGSPAGHNASCSRSICRSTASMQSASRSITVRWASLRAAKDTRAGRWDALLHQRVCWSCLWTAGTSTFPVSSLESSL